MSVLCNNANKSTNNNTMNTNSNHHCNNSTSSTYRKNGNYANNVTIQSEIFTT